MDFDENVLLASFLFGMVGMGMCDDGFIHRFPGIDVDTCLRAVNPVFIELEKHDAE